MGQQAAIVRQESAARSLESEEAAWDLSGWDRELHRRVEEYMRDEGLDQGEMADRIGYSRAMLNKYLSGALENPGQIESALRAYFIKQDRLASGKQFVEIKISRIVMEALEWAQSRRKLVVLYGPPESSKTTAGQEFMRRKLRAGESIVWVTANSVMTPASLAQRICEELGLPSYHSTPALLEHILARLKREPHLLIVDDAGFLTIKALEALRYLYDQAACGIALMGTDMLMKRLFAPNGRTGEELAQLYSRVDLQKMVPAGVSQREREQIVRKRASDLKDSEVTSLAEKPRKLRSLVKLLDRVSYLRGLNPAAAMKDLVSRAEGEIFEAA